MKNPKIGSLQQQIQIEALYFKLVEKQKLQIP